MPDLHTDAVHAFWDSYDRRTLYRVIVALERVETWRLDADPTIEKAILELGRAMDMGYSFEIEGKEETFVNILANIGAAKAIRVLQALDMASPGSASKLLMFAEKMVENKRGGKIGQQAEVFLSRNLVFEKIQLLSRVFSPHRVSLVLKALERWREV